MAISHAEAAETNTKLFGLAITSSALFAKVGLLANHQITEIARHENILERSSNPNHKS